jgi:aminoglycoside phosphotransferase (APT) family kinase protein
MDAGTSADAAAPDAVTVTEELSGWLEQVTDDPGPFTLTRLTGGNSNDTMLVRSPLKLRLLRRPPESTIDASAHSVDREYRMLMALSDTHVPVPRPIAIGHGVGSDGRAALLVEFVDGLSLTTELPSSYPPGSIAKIGQQTIDTLADLHSLPWRELGLTDLGRPEHFLDRQVNRWMKQYERYRHRELPWFAELAGWLERNQPPDGEPGILHGDFHVDNCLFSRDEPVRLRAVIDWEMATIGDPLLDVGLALAFWGNDRPAPVAMPRVQGFSRDPSAPSRATLARRYELRSGRSLEHLDYYMTHALWKLAAIVEGAHLHYTTGVLTTRYARDLERDVPRLLDEAARFAGL